MGTGSPSWQFAEAQIRKQLIGGSARSFSPDPLLYEIEARRRLMNVVTIGYVEKRPQDLLEALLPAGDR